MNLTEKEVKQLNIELISIKKLNKIYRELYSLPDKEINDYDILYAGLVKEWDKYNQLIKNYEE